MRFRETDERTGCFGRHRRGGARHRGLGSGPDLLGHRELVALGPYLGQLPDEKGLQPVKLRPTSRYPPHHLRIRHEPRRRDPRGDSGSESTNS